MSNPCDRCPPSTTECEALPSALDNFIYHFFGSISKSVGADGNIVWTLPCDLEAGLPNYPRAEGEGLACYFMRISSEALLGLVQANGLCNTANSFPQPAVGASIVVQVDNPGVLLAGEYVWSPGGGWYSVLSVAGVAATLVNLFAAPVNAPPGASVPAGRLVPCGPLDYLEDLVASSSASVLNSARAYADIGDDQAVNSAASYTDAQRAAAQAHSDANDAATLAAAQADASAKADDAEEAANIYTDQKSVADRDYADAVGSAAETAANLHSDANDAITLAAAKDYTDAEISALDGYIPATHAVFVSKVGNDSNTGLTPADAKLTIAAAITAADALILAGATGVNVEVIDAGTYTENITISDGVRVRASGATLVGTITIGTNCLIDLARHYSNGNNTTMLQKSGGSGHGFYRANVLDGRGSGGANTGTLCVRNVSNGSVLFVKVGVLFVPENGIGISDNGTGFGHIHFWTPDLYLAGNNAIGIQATSAATNFIGYIDHILETGSPTGTVAINLSNANAIVKLTATEIIADSVYTITSGALHLSSPKLTGARTGTPVVELSDTFVGTSATLSTPLALASGGTGAASAKAAVTNLVTVADNSNTTINLADSDSGTILRCTAGTAVTLNVPTGLSAGFNVMVIQQGGGQVTVTAVGTTLQASGGRLKTAAQYAVASIVRVAANTFNVSGDLVV